MFVYSSLVKITTNSIEDLIYFTEKYYYNAIVFLEVFYSLVCLTI